MSSSYSQERGRGGVGVDEPVLSERDRKELMSLANENISMDFILEMKEAFQLFDKVRKLIHEFSLKYPGIISSYYIFRGMQRSS